MRPKYYPRRRQPQKEDIIPFSLKHPIELKSFVSGTSGKERGQVCLYELSLLLACFKQTSFSQVACSSEIGDFQKCYLEAKKGTDYNRQVKRKGEIRSKNDANIILEKYSS